MLSIHRSRGSHRWIPANRNIAIKWAEEHGYPFQDRYELPQVAQYMAITKDNDMLSKKLS